MNAPASSSPRMLAGRSNDGLSENAAEAAAPRASPVMRRLRKIAPPGGSCRTSTSRAGLVNKASSGSTASTRLAGPSLRLAVKIVTAEKCERMTELSSLAQTRLNRRG